MVSELFLRAVAYPVSSLGKRLVCLWIFVKQMQDMWLKQSKERYTHIFGESKVGQGATLMTLQYKTICMIVDSL
ncbi:hypothetical protein MRB53_002401 [Persea americana]|uniref:Uncharacterized protein n=1 Tax=Persea americana TaxID=3435 RepID=A0ACC2MVB1_PERAE|nr:hypothetical protein MRB53_002401 [Persea americana]